MDDLDFDKEFDRMDSLPEEDVRDFVLKHSHDLNSCSFCEQLFDEYGQSVVAFLLSERYATGSSEPSAETVKQMCESLPLMYSRIESTAACVEELMDLTRLRDCTPGIYAALLSEMTPGYFNHLEWQLDDVNAFLRQRASLPNAPENFVAETVSWFHLMSHDGPVATCHVCQSIVRDYASDH